jgi:hypothetical protein
MRQPLTPDQHHSHSHIRQARGDEPHTQLKKGSCADVDTEFLRGTICPSSNHIRHTQRHAARCLGDPTSNWVVIPKNISAPGERKGGTKRASITGLVNDVVESLALRHCLRCQQKMEMSQNCKTRRTADLRR